MTHFISTEESQILEGTFWREHTTRQYLSQVTGFSRNKVSSLVSNLLSHGFMQEVGPQPHWRGKNNHLTLNAGLGYLIGVDLGWTSVTVALSTANMTVLHSLNKPLSPDQDQATVLTSITTLIRQLLELQQIQAHAVLAIGLGLPATVDVEGSVLSVEHSPQWSYAGIHTHLSRTFGVRVFLDNDANIMALGELWMQRRQHPELEVENMLVIKVGHGIGAGIIANGHLYRGHDGAAGDIGHICIDPEGPVCPCGRRGCLERLASARFIVEAAQRQAAREGSSLGQRFPSPDLIRYEAVLHACREGDPEAIEIIQHTGVRLGNVIANFVNFFNPSRVLIGGKIALAGPLLLASIRQTVYSRSQPISSRHLSVDYTQLNERSTVCGALTLALLSLLRDAANTQPLHFLQP